MFFNFYSWEDLSAYNGRTREKALNYLPSTVPDAHYLALIFRRLNDFAEPVRISAWKNVSRFLNGSASEIIVEALFKTLKTWSDWGHINNQEKDKLLSLMDKHLPACVDYLIQSPTGANSRLLGELGRNAQLDLFLPEIAQKALQPSLRGLAYRFLLTGKFWRCYSPFQIHRNRQLSKYQRIEFKRDLNIHLPFEALLEPALNDKSYFVRITIAEQLILNLPHRPDPHLIIRLMNDKHHIVAEKGRFLNQYFQD